mgnify:CR=1 FL=1
MEKKEVKREDFEIIQYRDNVFRIFFTDDCTEKVTTGFLWWRKTEILKLKEKYEVGETDVKLTGIYPVRFIYTPFETLKDARKWVDDYFKYPINHEA